jgi:hypothetical protein
MDILNSKGPHPPSEYIINDWSTTVLIKFILYNLSIFRLMSLLYEIFQFKIIRFRLLVMNGYGFLATYHTCFICKLLYRTDNLTSLKMTNAAAF